MGGKGTGKHTRFDAAVEVEKLLKDDGEEEEDALMVERVEPSTSEGNDREEEDEGEEEEAELMIVEETSSKKKEGNQGKGKKSERVKMDPFAGTCSSLPYFHVRLYLLTSTLSFSITPLLAFSLALFRIRLSRQTTKAKEHGEQETSASEEGGYPA